jgi:Flp pilus assembly protein TadD
MAFRLQDELGAPEPPGDETQRWKELLLNGAPEEQARAATKLVELKAESALLECLRSTNPLTVDLATGSLWECWMNEQGPAARRELERGIQKMNGGDLPSALAIFQRLAEQHPRWAEAQNKQATVLYLLGNARLSYKVAEMVVELKPHHFGAWNGMALCAAQMERWRAALRAARQAWNLQPSALANLDLIRLAEAKLSE